MKSILVKHGTFESAGRRGTVRMPYQELVALIGEPHFGVSNDGKVDKQWYFHRRGNKSHYMALWNFKNGPVYNPGIRSMDEVSEFSVSYINPEGKALAQEVFVDKFKEGM